MAWNSHGVAGGGKLPGTCAAIELIGGRGGVMPGAIGGGGAIAGMAGVATAAGGCTGAALAAPGAGFPH